jgi:ABC-2 type transport system permease protein
VIRLVGAELNRLLSRRLTLILTLAVIAIVGVFQLAVVQSVTPPSPAEVAAARQGFEDYRKDWQANHDEWEQDCLDDGGTPADCAQPEPTEADWGLAPTPFNEIAQAGVTFSVVMAMLSAYLLAASSIGAEYSTGSLGNWLTFVPRREKVYAAKVVALALGSAALAVLTGLLMVGAASIVTLAVGQPLTGLSGVVETAARGIPLVVFAALLGFCVGMLTRHTVAALGALLGYGLLVLGLYVVSFAVPPLSALKRWQLETNVAAFLMHGTQYQVIRRVVTADGVDVEGVARSLGFGAASAYLAIIGLALLAVTLLVFRRRDVT